jgi:TP901 family phage tail tape measure protein
MAVKNVGTLQAMLMLNDAAFMAGLSRASNAMTTTGARMKSIGRGLSMSLSLPLAAVGGVAVKMSMDFEASMSKIIGLVGVGEQEVNSMREEVLKLAGETARAPQELADGLFFVTSAGFRGAEAMEILESSARAAAAGLGTTKDIADLVTSAVNAYGSENLNAAQATDTLVAAVREGKVEADQMAQFMGMVLPIASQLGVTFTEVGASMAAMSRTGTNASTAVVQLRQILASILKPTKEAEEAWEQMGTSSKEMRDILSGGDGLIKVLSFLAEQTKTNEQAFVNVLPNVRALSGALDLMGKNSASNVEIFERMKDNTGDLNAAFAAAATTIKFKFNQALTDLKVAGIQLGDALMPLFIGLVDVIKKAANWFTNLDLGTRNLVISVGLLAAGIGPLLSVLGTLVGVIGGLFTPLGVTLVAVAALGLAAIYLADNWEAVKERMSKIGWLEILNAVVETTVSLVTSLVKSLNETWEAISKMPKTASAAYQELIDSTKNWKEEVGLGTDEIKKGEAEVDKYETQFKSLGETLSSVFSKLKGFFSGMLPATRQVSDGIEKITDASYELLIPLGITNNWLDGVRERMAALIEPIQTLTASTRLWSDAWYDFKEQIKETNFLVGVAQQAFNALGAVIVGETRSGARAFGDMVAGILRYIQTLIIGYLVQAILGLTTREVTEKGWYYGLISAAVGIGAITALWAKWSSKMPSARGGTFTTQPGVFQLHKDELVSLPAGAGVMSQRSSRNVMSGMGGMGGGTIRLSMRELIFEMDRERERLGL